MLLTGSRVFFLEEDLRQPREAYTELEGILGMAFFSSGAIKSKGEESEEFGVRIEIPSYMRCYIPENPRASQVGLGR